MGSKHISYRSGSKSVFFNMAAANYAAREFVSPIPVEDFNTMPWAPWGASNNLLPQEMVADIEKCGVLNAIIDAGGRFGLGEGLDPVIIKREGAKKSIDKYVDDPEIVNFLEDNNANEHNYGWMTDMLGMGNGICRIMLNGARDKIVQIRRHDVSEMRLAKKNDAGKITHVYLCAQWDKITSVNDNRVIKIPLLDPHNPIEDLREKAKNGVAEHAFVFRYPGWGKHYYSMPRWYSQSKWVKIAQGIPEMKAAMYENNMRPKFEVIIYEQYWENAYDDWEDLNEEEKEAKRNELYDDIDKFLSGNKNAFKSVFIEGTYGLDGKSDQQYIKIKPIEDNTKEGELLPDSAAANSEIAFAMLFNLAIVGGNQASGLYESSQGGSNVREGILMQIIIRELERMYVRKIYNLVKRFNGWDVKHPGLEFIIPATVLTTLDTGGSSKPVNTGGIDNKQQSNGAN